MDEAWSSDPKAQFKFEIEKFQCSLLHNSKHLRVHVLSLRLHEDVRPGYIPVHEIVCFKGNSNRLEAHQCASSKVHFVCPVRYPSDSAFSLFQNRISNIPKKVFETSKRSQCKKDLQSNQVLQQRFEYWELPVQIPRDLHQPKSVQHDG
ncbi:hypothetical protein F443_21584 [Phytophthora nicotianae P1569]|uniref:Uncharacterized protein n=1 Tax=Phytophthora nicotianae P1569 TaxID=1317065 RepID=V9DYV0_PHYNI|nr:hypothetical protein F443_21584 [Phytophthora nicotianae P1569]